MPEVSVCIPTHNGAVFLEETLESLKMQTYTDYEVIVCDDGSKDDTLKILEKFRKSSFQRVHIFKVPPKGIGANWNNCLQRVSGKYVKFLLQDDILRSDCLKKMVSYLEENRDVDLVASKRDFKLNMAVDEKLGKWISKYGDLQAEYNSGDNEILILDRNFFKSINLLKSPLNKIGEPSTIIFRRSMISKIGFFRTDLRQILDYEYWYRFLKYSKIAILPEKLVFFRLHKDQETQKNSKIKISDIDIYRKILYRDYRDLLNDEIRHSLENEFKCTSVIKQRAVRWFNFN